MDLIKQRISSLPNCIQPQGFEDKRVEEVVLICLSWSSRSAIDLTAIKSTLIENASSFESRNSFIVLFRLFWERRRRLSWMDCRVLLEEALIESRVFVANWESTELTSAGLELRVQGIHRRVRGLLPRLHSSVDSSQIELVRSMAANFSSLEEWDWVLCHRELDFSMWWCSYLSWMSFLFTPGEALPLIRIVKGWHVRLQSLCPTGIHWRRRVSGYLSLHWFRLFILVESYDILPLFRSSIS